MKSYKNDKKLTPIEVIQLVKDSISLDAGLDYYLGVNLSAVKGRKTKLIQCPFHNEKTASFAVTPDKNLFNCFGCGRKGDIVTLVSLVKNVSQASAAYLIAEDYNLLQKAAPELKKTAQEKAREKELERDFHKKELEMLNFFYQLKADIQASARANIKTVEDLNRFEKTYTFLLPQIDMFISLLETADENEPETRIENYISANDFVGQRIYPIILKKLEKEGVNIHE